MVLCVCIQTAHESALNTADETDVPFTYGQFTIHLVINGIAEQNQWSTILSNDGEKFRIYSLHKQELLPGDQTGNKRIKVTLAIPWFHYV